MTYFYREAPQFLEMASPIEKCFCLIKYAKRNSCTRGERSSGYTSSNIDTILKTGDEFMRRKAVAVLVWLKRLSGRW
jgi:hypothetical protein